MSLRFAFSDVAKGFADTITRELRRPIAKAATAAVRDAGGIAKRTGRASIAAAGFSRKWQNALRVNVYPPQGDSLRPAAFVFHKIRYAGVFEEGAVIAGTPLLWLPLPTVPLCTAGASLGVTPWVAPASASEIALTSATRALQPRPNTGQVRSDLRKVRRSSQMAAANTLGSRTRA